MSQIYKVWWMKKRKNFGDLLTPYILKYFSIPFEYSAHDKANILCIGSILDKARPKQIILGSGIIDESLPLCTTADWRFVRGPFTRKRILDQGGVCPEIYGDPAVLLPLFCKESKKEFDIGIVPHYVDYNYVKLKYSKYKVINVINENPFNVVEEITKCRQIISSSLHGIIVANAYNIPAAWVKFSNNLYGTGVKFFDYYGSIGHSATLSTVEDPIFKIGNINLTPISDIFKSLKDNICNPLVS